MTNNDTVSNAGEFLVGCGPAAVCSVYFSGFSFILQKILIATFILTIHLKSNKFLLSIDPNKGGGRIYGMKGTRAGYQEKRWEAGKFKFSLFLLTLMPIFFFLFSPTVHPSVPDKKKSPDKSAIQVPINLLDMGSQNPGYAFIIDKSAQRLHVYQHDEEGPKLVKTYVCATGENFGVKKQKGDKRTPEGVYFFTRGIDHKNLASIYGIRAFPMDYPNLLDRIGANKGDGIWLHGTDKPLTANSTNGCIALENQDVAEISKYIRLRRTPVIIKDKMHSTSLQDLNTERNRVRKILNDWKEAWEKKDLDRYMSYYSKAFHFKNMDWNGWRDHKLRLNRQYKSIQVTMEAPIILKHNQNVLAVFYQRYKSDRFFNEGTKKLYFTLEGNELKIIGEEWDPQRGGEIPDPIPENVLLAFAQKKPAASPAAPPTKAASELPPPSPPVASKASEPKPAAAQAQDATEIKAFLAAWEKSWEKKDLNQYMDCYSKAFRSKGKGWEQWKQHKKQLNSRYRSIQVSLDEIKIQQNGKTATISFRQTYNSDGLKSVGRKSLTLREEGNSWKIISEGFSRS